MQRIKSVRLIWFLALCLMCMAVLAGCAQESKQSDSSQKAFLVITDDNGRTVTLAKQPERILPLSTSYLEPLAALDVKIVGRVSSKNGIPKQYQEVPEVGAVTHVSVEKAIAQKPDLVILYKGVNDKLVSTFEQNNIPVIVLEMRTFEQVKHTVDILGKIVNKSDKANELNQQMDKSIAEIVAKVPATGKKVVILHSTAQNVSVQLDNSIAGNVAQMLHLQNIAAGQTPLANNNTSAPYSLETIVKANPDIVFVTSMGKLSVIKQSMQKNVESNPAWQSLPAVKAHHVYFLEQDLYLLSPGLRYPEAVKKMAKLAYPEIFK